MRTTESTTSGKPPSSRRLPFYDREPCPDRILDETGFAFWTSAVGGSVFHFFKGIYNSPKGKRLIGGSHAVRMNAPRIGGFFAVWKGLFSTFDCTMVYLRQKEDPWNSIFAGAATAGFINIRQGLAIASTCALLGGGTLALIEGTAITLTKVFSEKLPPPPPPPPPPVAKKSRSSSWVLLQPDLFLSELTNMYCSSTEKGSVWVTFKTSSMKPKPVKNKMVSAGETIEFRCLVRATDGKKTIFTSVSAKDHQRFQDSYATVLKAHMHALKKRERKDKKKEVEGEKIKEGAKKPPTKATV